MQVSTGAIFPFAEAAYLSGVLPSDLVMVSGTAEQVQELSHAVRRGRAQEAKKAARRATQRSRRSNRG